MSAIYDLILILDPAAADGQRAKVRADAEAAITAGGELVGVHDWGRRVLAYEIDHKTEGEYHLIQFRGPAALLETLQRSLSVTDGIIRFRIIKLAPGTPEPVEMEAAPAVSPVAAVPEEAVAEAVAADAVAEEAVAEAVVADDAAAAEAPAEPAPAA